VLIVYFLLGLLLEPEDGSVTFFRNAGRLVRNVCYYNPEYHVLNSHRSELINSMEPSQSRNYLKIPQHFMEPECSLP
jgi:hypothetical protein